MATDGYLEAIFPIQCRGRDSVRKEVLTEAVQVEICVSKSAGNNTSISLSVRKCPFNTGGHGQRCKASHPAVDKVGEGIFCAYAVDIPYTVDLMFK
jgi:hypothetical protein